MENANVSFHRKLQDVFCALEASSEGRNRVILVVNWTRRTGQVEDLIYFLDS